MDGEEAEEVLSESYMMIPESEKRMKESIEDLFAFMVRRMAGLRGGGAKRGGSGEEGGP